MDNDTFVKKGDESTSTEFKLKQLEEGIERASANHELFSQKAQEQMILKAQLQAELNVLKSKLSS